MAKIPNRLRGLLAGDVAALRAGLDERNARWFGLCGATIVVGGGVYGATLGLWRDGLQAVFTAIKFPLLIFLTCAGNAALNGCLSHLLGGRLGFRQTTLAILMAFAVTAMVLAALAPVVLFFLTNAPPLRAGSSTAGHSTMLLLHVAVIALAGVIGARRLFALIRATSAGSAAAWRILFGWLAGSFLLGTQLAWILRPFIGSPGLAVQFFRPHPLEGNFFESVWRAIHHLF